METEQSLTHKYETHRREPRFVAQQAFPSEESEMPGLYAQSTKVSETCQESESHVIFSRKKIMKFLIDFMYHLKI